MKDWMYVYMATPDSGIREWLRKNNAIFTEHLEFADVVFFPGGADVTPSLYGEKKLPCTHNNIERDFREVELYSSMDTRIPRVGICRGAQFLNVMAGGKLFQDVNNHACGTHLARCTVTKQDVSVTSTHHQMMRPAPDGEVLVKAALSTKKTSEHGVLKYKKPPEEGLDIEVVWYPGERSLCYQPHPEYDLVECENHFWSLYNKFIQPIIEENTQELLEGRRTLWKE